MLDMEKNKERYLKLLEEVLHEEDFNNIKEWLETGDFFSAPASTKYHLHGEGGLCQHSLNVYDCLSKKLKDWGLEYPENSIRIVSLMHDWCKINVYVKSTRRVPPERSGTGKRETEEVWIKDDAYHLGHASKSVYLIQQFIPLNMLEIEAIHSHMGSTDLSTMFNSFDLNSILSVNPLAICLHLADMESSYLMEGEIENKV